MYHKFIEVFSWLENYVQNIRTLCLETTEQEWWLLHLKRVTFLDWKLRITLELKVLNFEEICQSLTGNIVWAVGVWYCFRRAYNYRKSNYVDNTSKGSKSVDNKKNDYDRGSAQYMPPDE